MAQIDSELQKKRQGGCPPCPGHSPADTRFGEAETCLTGGSGRLLRIFHQLLIYDRHRLIDAFMAHAQRSGH